jgi:hypothetical protein
MRLKSKEQWAIILESKSWDNNKEYIEVYIQSDDLFNPIKLYVQGDFASTDEKVISAQSIVDLLNRETNPIKEQNFFNTPVYGEH